MVCLPPLNHVDLLMHCFVMLDGRLVCANGQQIFYTLSCLLDDVDDDDHPNTSGLIHSLNTGRHAPHSAVDELSAAKGGST